MNIDVEIIKKYLKNIEKNERKILSEKLKTATPYALGYYHGAIAANANTQEFLTKKNIEMHKMKKPKKLKQTSLFTPEENIYEI